MKQRLLWKWDAVLVMCTMSKDRTIQARGRLYGDCGGFWLTTAWHEWVFAWTWPPRRWLWHVQKGGVFLGPFQFSHIDLASLAALEAEHAVKWGNFE